MGEDPQPRKIQLIFFRTPAGSEPVREWLKELPEGERQAIGRASALAGNDPPLLAKSDPLRPLRHRVFRLAAPRGIRRG